MSEAHGWASPSGERPAAAVPPPAPSPGSPHPAPQPAPHPGGPQAHAGWGMPPGWTGAPAPLKPGIVPLRPLSAVEVYDGAFQAVRTNPGPLIGVSAVVVAVLYALRTAGQVLAFDSSAALLSGDPEALQSLDQVAGPIAGLVVTGLLSGVLDFLATTVLAGIVTVAVSTAVLGRRTALAELWQRVRPRLLPLVGSALVVAVLTGLAVAVCLAPGVALLVPGFIGASHGLLAAGAVLLLIGVLAAVAVALVLSTRLSLATPAVVLEGQSVLAGLRRSWHLTGRGFWRVLGVRLLALVVLSVAAAAIAWPLSLLGQTIAVTFVDDPTGTQAALAALVPAAIGGALAATVVYPLTAAITALQYVDQRMRLEGLDVELARAASAA